MVEASASQRKRLGRFTPWVNKLELEEADKAKVVEVKKTITKVDFVASGPVTKHFECRVLQSKVPVTLGYAERRKKDPIFDAFGIGTGDEAIKGNATINMLHRNNVWHPYYEIKTEEEDLGTKIRNRQAENKVNQTEGQEIAELKANLNDLKKNQAEENEQRGLEAITGPKKRTFDAKAIQAKKQAQEQSEEAAKIPDPKGIRLTELTSNITEEELKAEIQNKFGKIERIYLPLDQGRGNKNRGFAIINFAKQESAAKAIQEGQININFVEVRIAQSYQQQRRNDRDGDRREFDQLKQRRR